MTSSRKKEAAADAACPAPCRARCCAAVARPAQTLLPLSSKRRSPHSGERERCCLTMTVTISPLEERCGPPTTRDPCLSMISYHGRKKLWNASHSPRGKLPAGCCPLGHRPRRRRLPGATSAPEEEARVLFFCLHETVAPPPKYVGRGTHVVFVFDENEYYLLEGGLNIYPHHHPTVTGGASPPSRRVHRRSTVLHTCTVCDLSAALLLPPPAR